MHEGEQFHGLRDWCGKVGYATKKDALTVRNTILKGHSRKRNKPKDLRAYHCESCGLFHLTKQL